MEAPWHLRVLEASTCAVKLSWWLEMHLCTAAGESADELRTTGVESHMTVLKMSTAISTILTWACAHCCHLPAGRDGQRAILPRVDRGPQARTRGLSRRRSEQRPASGTRRGVAALTLHQPRRQAVTGNATSSRMVVGLEHRQC